MLLEQPELCSVPGTGLAYQIFWKRLPHKMPAEQITRCEDRHGIWNYEEEWSRGLAQGLSLLEYLTPGAGGCWFPGFPGGSVVQIDLSKTYGWWE